MQVFTKFTVNAARRLPNLPVDHVCARLHGHTFGIEVQVTGDIDGHSGWVIDFADIEQPVNRVLAELEHRYLNDVAGLENPTSENLAAWLWARVAPDVPGLSCIVITEGVGRGCRYYGPA